jgi:hypothetical protein
LRENPTSLPFGLLAGDLCLCPKTKLQYLLLDDVARSRAELTTDDPRAQLAAELRSLGSHAAERGKLALGWYIGGMGAELELDPEADSLHRELFPESWQVVLLHDIAEGIERGAFLRIEPMMDRTYPIPFFELLSEEGGRSKSTQRRTVLRWVNYRAAEPLLPLDEPSIAATTTAAAVPLRGKSAGSGWFGLFRGANNGSANQLMNTSGRYNGSSTGTKRTSIYRPMNMRRRATLFNPSVQTVKRRNALYSQ